jgi:hypothetical protein
LRIGFASSFKKIARGLWRMVFWPILFCFLVVFKTGAIVAWLHYDTWRALRAKKTGTAAALLLGWCVPIDMLITVGVWYWIDRIHHAISN